MKGKTNNPNGRPKGSKNRISADVRTLFQSLLEENMGKIKSDLEKLSSKDRIAAFMKMTEFVLPKLSSISLDNEFKEEELNEFKSWKAQNKEIKIMTDKDLIETLKRDLKCLENEEWDSKNDNNPRTE